MLSVEDILQPENVSYTDNVWTWAVAHMLHKGEDWQITTITDTAPIEIVFLSKGEPLTDFIISGNTVQDGTPTPEAPVDVVGCGEKTTNLIPPKNTTTYKGITFATQLDGTILCNGTADSEFAFGYLVPASVSGDYYFSGCPAGGSNQTYDVYCYDKTALARPKQWNGTSASISDFGATKNNEVKIVSGHDTEIRIRFREGYHAENLIFKMMLREPAAPSEFEPYGYKLPPTVNGTEYPIYLGSCQTTRRIRKLVLTGEEAGWNRSGAAGRSIFYLDTITPDYLRSDDITLLCSHYKAIAGVSEAKSVGEGETSLYKTANSYQRIYFGDNNYSVVDDFKTYIAQQYANGTPVTVWYVLATPATGIVNEPLHKIGYYADTISMAQAGVTIPTAAGANTLLVDTTVQPSSMSITGKIREAADV